MNVHYIEDDEPDVSSETKEAFYRIAQEALHNFVKHAKAQHAWVTLRNDHGAVALEIRDDGVGFVAHNARFDADFIEAELGRVTNQQPPLATLCRGELRSSEFALATWYGADRTRPTDLVNECD